MKSDFLWKLRPPGGGRVASIHYRGIPREIRRFRVFAHTGRENTLEPTAPRENKHRPRVLRRKSHARAREHVCECDIITSELFRSSVVGLNRSDKVRVTLCIRHLCEFDAGL